MKKFNLYKTVVYTVFTLLAVTVLVPVLWVLLASFKQNTEFYGNPWTLPEGVYFQNFVDAFKTAKMGEYMLSSVIVTALALILILVISLPAAYCLSRFSFLGNNVLNALFMAGLFINVNYIVVPIFLMLRDGDNALKDIFGSGFLLNNLFILALVYAATALPFTIYLLSSYFAGLPHDFEEAVYPSRDMPAVMRTALFFFRPMRIFRSTSRLFSPMKSESPALLVDESAPYL